MPIQPHRARDVETPENRLGFLINKAGRGSRDRLAAAFSQTGCTIEEWAALRQVWLREQDGLPTTHADLEDVFRVELADLDTVLGHLSWRGLMTVEGGEATLTEAGRIVVHSLATLAESVLVAGTTGFTRAELDTLLDLLARFVDNLES
jgi:hypothetical protein